MSVWYAPMSVWFAPINCRSLQVDFEDAARSPQADAAGVITQRPSGVEWDLIASPIDFSDMPDVRPAAAPSHGADMKEVLAELGVVGEAALGRLAAEGAFGVRAQPKL
jgi:crotonobetainyl-CoA:carnitine CoA-transferase CaiB-like acyl-CoA transferase